MTARVLLVALVALAPIALGTAPVAASGGVSVPLCTGGDTAQTIILPLGNSAPAPREAPPCCGKWCHAGGRKRVLRRAGRPT